MGIENSERVVENLRKQLSVAVRSVQWSYAIFWSLSTTQQGLLEWGDGYYNGDIKTRRTVPAAEVCADKLGLRRSEQLRDLYESLLDGESDPPGTTRPCSVLSPEDLSDLEWYYLVCMSFTFKVGQSLPGKAFSSGQSVWLCNVQDADCKQFSRSLLAKSAAVKTVISFPHMGGVIELGVTDLVSEDPNLIQHVKTSLLEFAKPVCADKPSSSLQNADDDEDRFGAKIPDMDEEILESETIANLFPVAEDFSSMGSPDDCSKECCENNQQKEDSFMFEGHVDDVIADSPVQSWQIADDDDDDLSHFIQDSFNSSGCISQAFMSPQKTTLVPMYRTMNDGLHLKEIHDCNDTKFGSVDLGNDDVEDLHYKRILSVILQSSRLASGKYVYKCGHKSSNFIPWKKECRVNHFASLSPQRALKKILFTVPLIIATNDEKDALPYKPCPNNKAGQPCFPDYRREIEKSIVLRSSVPSTNMVDKTSILDDRIEYLKELEARLEELESRVNHSESEPKARRKHMDVAEQTYDNYHNNSRSDAKNMLMNKRKASDIDETEGDPLLLKVGPFDNNMALDVKVTVKEAEVGIQVRCPWREYLLVDIMDAVNSLHLDAQTVQSSTVDGMLILSLNSKFRGAAFASAGMIKQALRKMVGMC